MDEPDPWTHQTALLLVSRTPRPPLPIYQPPIPVSHTHHHPCRARARASPTHITPKPRTYTLQLGNLASDAFDPASRQDETL